MAFIVIEKHGGWQYAVIIPNTKTGDNHIFSSSDDAIEAVKECRDGIILNLENLSVLDNYIEAAELLIKIISVLKSGVFTYSNNATEKDIEYFKKLKKKLKAYDH